MKTEIGELKKQIEAKNKTLQRYIRSIRYTWTESTLEDLVDRLGKSHMKQDRKSRHSSFLIFHNKGSIDII